MTDDILATLDAAIERLGEMIHGSCQQVIGQIRRPSTNGLPKNSARKQLEQNTLVRLGSLVREEGDLTRADARARDQAGAHPPEQARASAPLSASDQLTKSATMVGNTKRYQWIDNQPKLVTRLTNVDQTDQILCETWQFLAGLDPARPRQDVPAGRWAQFVTDARTFEIIGLGDQARRLGWGFKDL